MKDGSLKKIIKKVARSRYGIDLAFTRFINKIQGEARYILGGTCNQCGMCCETPAIPVYSFFIWFKSLRFLFLSWHKIINGFEYLSEDRKNKVFFFHCTHHDPITKRCDSYESRPGLCRDYPMNLLFSSNPDFLDKCGHYAVLKNAEGFRKAFDKIDLSPQKRDELYEKLNLKE